MDHFLFPVKSDSADEVSLRREVREFLKLAIGSRKPVERAQSWTGIDPGFSKQLGERGWIGMTWPKRYGGAERAPRERYTVCEELLAAGAPVAAHWFADRQSGPALLRFGTEAQRQAILPRIARGECYFCVGMSEPDVGSDLASVKTRAVAVPGGYRISGTKLWTTNAHFAHYMILLARSQPVTTERHAGLSQFIVDMATPGITVRPILIPSGEHHFNEVTLEDVMVPQAALLGREGEGWSQVMSELALERSGPERWLSSFALFSELVRISGTAPSERASIALGRLVAHLVTLRRMSRSVASAFDEGRDPTLQAVMIKDSGAVFEQEIPEIARSLAEFGSAATNDASYSAVLAYTTLHSPSFSIRGGAREILRGIIARGLGLR